MHRAKSVEGLSRKSQELYLAVFCARYLDLFLPHRHWTALVAYNTAMKVFFIAASATIVAYFHKMPWKATYQEAHDTLRHALFLVLPSLALGFLLASEWTPLEVLYTFSIVLESVAIWPQLVVLQRDRNVENLTANFVFALGVYRGFYILNWAHRYLAENHVTETVVWVFGVIQTCFYIDFFYYYYQAAKRGRELVLPR